MRITLTLPALAVAAALVSTPAFAQSQGPSQDRGQASQAPTQQTQEQLELMVRGDKLIGKDVVASDGKRLGEIKDVLAGTDGHMQSVIIETESFLGMGGRKVSVPLNKMRIEGDRIGADLTREQAADMPEHKEPANQR